MSGPGARRDLQLAEHGLVHDELHIRAEVFGAALHICEHHDELQDLLRRVVLEPQLLDDLQRRRRPVKKATHTIIKEPPNGHTCRKSSKSRTSLAESTMIMRVPAARSASAISSHFFRTCLSLWGSMVCPSPDSTLVSSVSSMVPEWSSSKT